jgi:ABC-type phosphate/phosphonate transport system substrate-binding protein
MLASLPMYDMPEIRSATDRFWKALSERLGATATLARPNDYQRVWRDPDLVFSQTCGYPLTHEFRDQLIYVATPHYNAYGCQGPLYCSIIFAHEKKPLEEFRNARAAINNRDSMSGMLALKLAIAPYSKRRRFLATVTETGSHIDSLEAVSAGAADICAIDAVTVQLLRRYRPRLLESLNEIARTPQVPGLPYVTRCGDVVQIQKALQSLMVDRDMEPVRETLLLCGLTVMSKNAYDIIANYERSMQGPNGVELFD